MGLWSDITGVVDDIIGAVKSVVAIVFTFVYGLVSLILEILLFWAQKKIRVSVCVLHPDKDSKPLASIEEVQASIARANAIIKKDFNARLIMYGDIQMVKEDPPPSSLSMECTVGHLFQNETNAAGDFYRKYTSGWNFIPISAVFPITVFVIAHVTNNGDEWKGCSPGPFGEYLVITPDGLNDDTSLAHEMGHSCNLWHVSAMSNLMYHGDTRHTVIRVWQRELFRASRHVNFW